ncbi:MAG: type II toxin-antitoxin system PemK/MazF family toxin [Longimicrobiales bacterium]|nr:type II toxin-antitoxin system PemK/MazF family toxin [Longimicrobiales bacterium]
MRRGDLYRVRHPSGDPKRSRVFVVVSRPALIRARFATVICAPVLTHGEGLTTQVAVGPAQGLKHASWITCDGLTSIEKSRLTDFIGALPPDKLRDLTGALRSALDLHS